MRVDYLSQSFLDSSAANSVHVIKMCAALSNHGHEVTLHAAKRGIAGAAQSIEIEKHGVKKGAFDARQYIFPRLGFLGRVFYALCSGTAALKNRDTYIVSRHSWSLVVPALAGRPFVLEMHAPPADHREARLITWLAARRGFCGLIVISNALRDIYRAEFPLLPSNQLHVLPDGADEHHDLLSAQCPTELQLGVFNCGYAGHLYKGRGIDLLLRVAAELPEITFHIIGGRSEDVDHWRSVAQVTNVIFYGHMQHRYVAAALHRMDVLLAPYQREVSVAGGGVSTAAWMSPLKLFEYMAAGKPIICSDLPVLREVMISHHNCLMVDPSTPAQWRDAISLIRTDKDFGRALGRQAAMDLATKYTWSIRAGKILALFEI
jgi:glycosyltransferase involved in cell wall biosynthesis